MVRKNFVKLIKYFLVTSIIFVCAMFILNNKTYAEETTLYIEGKKGLKEITLVTDSNGTYSAAPLNRNISLHSDILYNQTNVFCINKGRSFSGTLNCYDQIFFRIENGVAKYSIDGKALTPYTASGFKADYNNKEKDELRDFATDLQVGGNDFTNLLSSKDNINKLAYILSEVGGPAIEVQNDGVSYRNQYQGAIWSLQKPGQDVLSFSTSDKEKQNTPINLYGWSTDKLMADAAAYSKFVTNGPINQKVGIITTGATVNILNGNAIIGPISFDDKYSPVTAGVPKIIEDNVEKGVHQTNANTNNDYDKPTTGEKYNIYYQGVYGQITSMEIGGQTITISGSGSSGSQVYTDAACSDTSRVTGYIPKTSIYIKLTEKQYNNIKSNQTVNITVTVNNQYRQGYFWVLRCNGKSEYSYTDDSTATFWKEIEKTGVQNEYTYNYCTVGITEEIDGEEITRPCNNRLQYVVEKDENNVLKEYLVCSEHLENKVDIYARTPFEINYTYNKMNHDIFRIKSYEKNTYVYEANHLCTVNTNSGSDDYGTIISNSMVIESGICSNSKHTQTPIASTGSYYESYNGAENEFSAIRIYEEYKERREIIKDSNTRYLQNIIKRFGTYGSNISNTFFLPYNVYYCEDCDKIYKSDEGIMLNVTYTYSGYAEPTIVSINSCESYTAAFCGQCKEYVLFEMNPFLMKYYKISKNNYEKLFNAQTYIGSLSVHDESSVLGTPHYVMPFPECEIKVTDKDTNIQNQIVGGGSSSSGTAGATIKVQTVIDKLEIIKENAATGSRMNVPLTLKITGASKAKIEGEERTVNNGIITAEDVSTETGGIQIENIVLATGKNSITLEISEPNIAGYLQWSAPLVLDVTKTASGLTVTKVSGPDFLTLGNNNINYKGHGYEYYTGNKIISGNTAKITVTNIPLINVEGVVYLDGQAGVKDVQVPNGIKDNSEPGIEGIKVYLKDKNNNAITDTTTDANGNYSFTGILAQPYYIFYEYNGMKYEVSKNQDAQENRGAFNETFNFFRIEVSLKAKNKDNIILDNDFTKIMANTKEEGKYIDLKNGQITVIHYYGLLEREADLALGVMVDSITVSTNGKTSTEKFGTSNAQKNVDLPENRIIDYHKALAEIDYNFTMEDYENVWGLEEENFTEGAKFNQTTMDITYLIEIKNVCARDAYVNKIKIKENEHLLKAKRDANIEYYYSNNNVPNSFVATKDNEDSFNIGEFGNISAGNSLYLKITYTDIPREYIQIDNTFELEAEIMSYSTSGVKFSNSWTTAPNMVDIDSTPANWDESEDDYGKAVVKLTSNETAERKIDGIVFEDGKTEQAENYKFGNGNFDNGEEKLNGVVVQLIELKDVEILTQIYTCEYLWQETVTGSNVVKRISDDGTEIIVETHDEEIGKGQYMFKDVLPGTYIVRFRYGETYADNYVKVADGDVVSIDTYNGINYKSTTDENYNQEWYNKSNYTNGQAPSVARDIEAKRLELMSKTVVASTANGVTDKGMVAQTSKINIAQSTDSLENTNATILYDSVNSKKIEFDNISFGLELRPQTEISLEKHITGLSIVNGRNVFLTYTEDPENSDKEFPNLKSKLIGKRDRRGKFVFETDTELLQGADLKVSYTYTMANNSEKDYLSKDLIEKYASFTPEQYANYLKQKADDINKKIDEGYDIGKYVGTQYYTGVVDTNEVSEVALKVEEMVDYLNNDFEYSNQSDNAEFEIVDTKDKLAYVKANPNAADGATVTYKEETGHAENGLKSTNSTKILAIGESATKTATIKKEEKLSPTETLTFIGYNAEITDYSIPSGRISSIQGVNNINYVVTEDDSKGPEETDESWSENLEITKNTGIKDDQNNTVQIITISTTVIAIITAGAIAVKKFVIK